MSPELMTVPESFGVMETIQLMRMKEGAACRMPHADRR